VASFKAKTPFDRELNALVMGGTLRRRKDNAN
jgi:hypothetical protein